MGDLTLYTFKWVPEPPRGYLRDLRVRWALEEAGLPEGLFQVVCGEGPDVGPALIDQADYVMFTGSTATGRVIGERAGRNLIGSVLSSAARTR